MSFKIDVLQATFAVLTLIVFLGTVYSVKNNTYLDTSDPLITHLPHHLHNTHYFATKSNFLNVLFIKRAWAWTSSAFLSLWITSPHQQRSIRRLYKWALATAAWLVFTSWFFGPALLERFIAASGGECTVSLPSGAAFSIPNELCFTKSRISPVTHPSLFASPLLLPEGQWTAIPRMRRGHDVSGHLFLVTMSILFLADQLTVSLRSSSSSWTHAHKYAIIYTAAIIGMWLFAAYTTSVYFHTPLEKLTGYLLGVAGYALTRII
ncbi:Fat storage-inducing transmembrane protein [Scleroderma yunnanense]